ncbi:MotA/TolQ/ExbB proton channel family protein [Pseudoalteromonas luteoviolacea]|uniref:MotA/TolQ/ExbB proton channel domain-containing protein n=2 Tax=Pseudoalteromonas luteoviolacea TaxID=43657 RepID=A0A0F6AE78_9GAMM|nr:MotA/TolQ/ExbB proton channel family protein [Pseudoalteromonas luteoviolacea]AOT17817.1 hypothetical protein S4054_09080 [Pseudoalteromonas luteoviolacea]KKE84463.1 hypothetical protein N479_09485 [Pseudoalteromonas luteoviolacea S4054]KZN71838.1 hypothetical protein N481_18025 [Pseudoalteromonas luteoviolacea S4047-1]
MAMEPDLKAELIKRIASAQQQLTAAQMRINDEHKKIANQLQAQLKTVKKLRNEARNIRRLEDEQLLNVNQLEQRNQQWVNQKSYQAQLIAAFEKTTQSHISNDNGNIDINRIISTFNKKLEPTFKQKQLFGSDNTLATFDVIKIGPIEYAINNKEAGIVSKTTDNGTPILKQFHQQNTLFNDLAHLKSSGFGFIHFDPTLGNADKLAQSQFSFFDYLNKGGTWAIPIISFALAALIIGLFKAIQLSRLPHINTVTAQVIKYANKPISPIELKALYVKLSTIEQALFNIVQQSEISQKRDDLLLAELSKQKALNEKYIGVITTCATVAPLLGLLGTVSGMIHTFLMMNIFGSGEASVVSGGISQALITTELGLIVAIPALIVSALLTRRVKSFQSSLESLALHLSKLEISQQEQIHG